MFKKENTHKERIKEELYISTKKKEEEWMPVGLKNPNTNLMDGTAQQ